MNHVLLQNKIRIERRKKKTKEKVIQQFNNTGDKTYI